MVHRDIESCDQTLAAIKAIGDSLDQKPKASPAAPWMPPVLPEARIYKPSDAEWLIARDSALLQILPSALVANYWKIEVTPRWLRSLPRLRRHGVTAPNIQAHTKAVEWRERKPKWHSTTYTD